MTTPLNGLMKSTNGTEGQLQGLFVENHQPPPSSFSAFTTSVPIHLRRSGPDRHKTDRPSGARVLSPRDGAGDRMVVGGCDPVLTRVPYRTTRVPSLGTLHGRSVSTAGRGLPGTLCPSVPTRAPVCVPSRRRRRRPHSVRPGVLGPFRLLGTPERLPRLRPTLPRTPIPDRDTRTPLSRFWFVGRKDCVHPVPVHSHPLDLLRSKGLLFGSGSNDIPDTFLLELTPRE